MLLSTLGFTKDKLLPAVAAEADVRKVIIYHAPGETPAKERKAKNALTAVLRSLEGSRARVLPIALPHPWRVRETLEIMLRDLRRERPEHCVFNLTGGTKAMAVAATLACVLTGTRAIYVPEESPDPSPVRLPLPPLVPRQGLTAHRARVLRRLAEREYESQAALARALRLAESTVHHHVAALRAMGAVESQDPRSRESPPRVTETGRLLLLLREATG